MKLQFFFFLILDVLDRCYLEKNIADLQQQLEKGEKENISLHQEVVILSQEKMLPEKVDEFEKQVKVELVLYLYIGKEELGYIPYPRVQVLNCNNYCCAGQFRDFLFSPFFYYHNLMTNFNSIPLTQLKTLYE